MQVAECYVRFESIGGFFGKTNGLRICSVGPKQDAA